MLLTDEEILKATQQGIDKYNSLSVGEKDLTGEDWQIAFELNKAQLKKAISKFEEASHLDESGGGHDYGEPIRVIREEDWQALLNDSGNKQEYGCTVILDKSSSPY